MYRKIIYPVILVLFFMYSCDTPSSTEESSPTPETSQQTQAIKTHDDIMAEIAEEIEGFGGMYIGDKNQVNVYVKNVAKWKKSKTVLSNQIAAQISNRINRKGSANNIMSADNINLLAGKYDFLQLYSWKNKLNSIMDIPEVIFTEISEKSNELLIGIKNESAISTITYKLTKLDLPNNSYSFKIVEPFQFMQSQSDDDLSLRDETTYKLGGLQIAFGNNSICTMGFRGSPDSEDDSDLTDYYVTNSHCTNQQGGVENTDYHQPTLNGDFIGTEVNDPTYFLGSSTNDCPSGRRCRYSDAALVHHELGPTTFSFYGIFKTESRGQFSGSIEIADQNSNTSYIFEIIDEMGTFFPGSEVNKVGRTTGWTYGNITNTCVDVNVTNSDITLLCQDLVESGVGPGDSGSPVFSYASSYTSDDPEIVLRGILWGGNQSGTQFVFSSITNIQNEIGHIDTHSDESNYDSPHGANINN